MRARTVVLAAAVAIVGVPAGVLGVDAIVRWTPAPPSAIAVDTASNLDEYLKIHEDSVLGVKPAQRKGIIWRDASHHRTNLAIAYLHGFSASRAELSPVVERLADSLGANVFFTRLAAHGRVDGEAFATVTAQQWIDDAREAFAIARRIGDRVVLVGTSTGALLAMELAADTNIAPNLAAMILVSPNHEPADRRAWLAAGPFGPMIARLAGGAYHGFRPENAQHQELWTTRYRSEGLSALMNLVRHARSLDVSRIQVPLLTLYTHRDDVVRVDLIRSRHDQFGSHVKEIVDVPDAPGHVLAGDALAPRATNRTIALMLAFVRAARVR